MRVSIPTIIDDPSDECEDAAEQNEGVNVRGSKDIGDLLIELVHGAPHSCG
jgi:hypothetical protein